MCCVTQSLGAVFFNKGENCIAAGRVFVERSIHDEFVERVVSRQTDRLRNNGCDAVGRGGEEDEDW